MVEIGGELGGSWNGKVCNKQGFRSVEKAVNLYCALLCELKLTTSWGWPRNKLSRWGWVGVGVAGLVENNSDRPAKLKLATSWGWAELGNISKSLYIVKILFKYCANIVHILCKYFPNILHIMCNYFTIFFFKSCTNVVKILCKYCANIVQIFCKYCPNIAQILYKYCANIVQILC